MKLKLSNLSIKYKLILIQLLIVLIVMVINGSSNLLFNIHSHKDSAINNLRSTAGIISLNLVSTLIFKDPFSAEEILGLLKNEEDIQNAWIYDQDGALFAKYSRPENVVFHFPRGQSGTVDFDGDFATIVYPISRDNEEYGTVHIRMAMNQYRAAVQLSILVISIGLLAGMIVALLLSIYSQKIITDPIKNLSETIDGIIKTNTFSTHIARNRGDELGKLYQAFNHMINQISQRQKERDLVFDALKKSEASLLNAQRLAKMGSWEYDLADQTIIWSDQIFEIFGLSKRQITEEQFLAMIHPEDAQRVRSVFAMAVQTRKTATLEYRIITTQGQVKHVVDTGSEIANEKGEVIKLLGTIQDISVRKEAEEALLRLNDELEARVKQRTHELEIAKEKAEGSDQLKSAFLASMSHELRTPLNSIIGFTGILLQGLVGPLNPEQHKQLGMVQGSSRHLLNLINDVLDISKIEAGQMTVLLQPFELSKSISNIVESLRLTAEKKGLSLTAQISKDIPFIISDRRRVEQILINLINNAIKFTETGSIRVDCSIENDVVTVSVEDTGIGISAEDFQKLFRPFQQIESGLSRKYEGTGLGLSICKKLLIMLGGDIYVQSQAGSGSRFYFSLPIKKGGLNE